jgi:hypothetical protein
MPKLTPYQFVTKFNEIVETKIGPIETAFPSVSDADTASRIICIQFKKFSAAGVSSKALLFALLTLGLDGKMFSKVEIERVLKTVESISKEELHSKIEAIFEKSNKVRRVRG